MKYSNILSLISTFLISVSVYSVPVSEHAISTQEFENEPASREASVPGLIEPGFQLPLFPKPPTLL